MNNRILSSVSFLVAMTALAAPSLAFAQVDTRCRPDDLLCADVGIGPIEGHLRIGPGDEPPPVVVQTPPVVVQQPPVVVVAGPPPPQIVVVQPPPREPQVITMETRRERRVVYDLVPTFDLGLHLAGGVMFSDRLAIGGANAAFRIRPESHIAIDIGTGFYGGSDYNGANHWEMPLQADLLVFFNPENMFQVYGVIGGGMSFGHADGYGSPSTGSAVSGRDLMYAGGEVGLGAELRLSRFFAINLDVRGFLRQQVGGGAPEFSQISAAGLEQTTNTSMGIYGQLGMTFYFIGNR